MFGSVYAMDINNIFDVNEPRISRTIHLKILIGDKIITVFGNGEAVWLFYAIYNPTAIYQILANLQLL